jgi:ribonuclease P protein component
MGLPKKHRLRRPGQFVEVRQIGKSKPGKCLIMAVLLPESRVGKPVGTAQCGFAISRKMGNAVHRNQFRRRLREISREAQNDLLPGVWIVIIPRKPGMVAAFAELRAEWRYLAKKLGVLREEIPNQALQPDRN